MSGIAAEIRAELRSIIRQKKDLRKPIESFELVESRPPGEPRYRVLFDKSPRQAVAGLRIAIREISLPDERIEDASFEFAKSVWQLKDRLNNWIKVHGSQVKVEEEAKKSTPLLICRDLANWKKHGGKQNESGLNPRIELVTFDTSRSGALELYYDGASKQKQLLVENNMPIPYCVDVLGNNGTLGNAVDLIEQGFQYWLPIIKTIGFLSGSDKETEYLRQELLP